MNALRFAVLATVTALLAAPLVVVACKDSPQDAIDPTDIPKGGVRVNPGFVTCGPLDGGCNFTAPAQCCSGSGAPGGGVCIDAGLTCPPGSGVVTCNEAADCLLTEVCCATMTATAGGGISLTAACATTCPAPSMPMCRTNGECKTTRKCVVQTCPDGQLYELCGAYADPDSGLQCSPR